MFISLLICVCHIIIKGYFLTYLLTYLQSVSQSISQCLFYGGLYVIKTTSRSTEMLTAEGSLEQKGLQLVPESVDGVDG